MKSKRGFTLIELLVAISIASMVTIGIQQLLDTALTAWRVSIEEVTIGKLSEEVLQDMIEGTDEYSGIRDALEIVEANPDSIKFVPMWVDSFDRIPEDGKFILTKKIRPGTPPPICEIKFPGSKEFQSYPAALHGNDGISKQQWVDFGFPIKRGSTVLVGYQPDERVHPDLIMEYAYDPKSEKIWRKYNHTATEFALHREGIKIASLRFVYFDGRNIEVDLKKEKSKANALSRITAVKIELGFEGREFKRKSTSLVNVRALGKSGQGVLLSEKLEIPLPDSEHIRILQLVNFTGVHDGNVVELKIGVPGGYNTWRIKLTLGMEDEAPVLTHYEIYYPGDKLAMERSEDMSLNQGLDLLNLDLDGLYDYDDDPSVSDQVMFKGNEITLTVLRSDPEGVMLVVRP